MNGSVIHIRPAVTRAQRKTNDHWQEKLARRRAIAAARLASLLDRQGRCAS